MSATRSPATPPASRTTPPPSPHTSQQELDLPASSPLRNTGDSSPLDLSPISSPEKPSRDPTKLLDHHHHDSPSPPGDLGNLASRTSADNIASLPAEIDSALRQVSTNNPNANNLHNTNPTLNINTTATTSNGLNPAADESSPMELVDEDIGAALELEGSDEYLGDDYMQDLRRVKVYELVDQNWKDLGTAFCSGEFDDQIREAQLIAKSEETQEVLLQITVRADEVYQRQADTLIVWTEPNGKDYALSFQDVEGCSEVWEFISEVRRHLRTAPEVDPASAFPDATVIQPRIPTPTLDNLAEIDLQIRSVHRASPIRDRVVENVLSLDLIRKLVKLMSDAEDLQSVKDLHQICSLMQAILLLNDSNIYEHILRDDVFIDMVGLMEYDPEFPDLKAHYRDFLQSNARHHQVIEFRDVGIQTKVHQTYRLQYLKDVVLARVLDDPIFNVLNSLVIFNQIEIVQYIQSEEYFLRELFSLFVQHPGTAPIPPLAAAAVQPTPLLEPTMATLSAGQNPSTPLSPVTSTTIKSEPTPTTTAFSTTSSTSIATPTPTPAPFTTIEDKRPAALLLLHQFCSMGKNVQLPMRLNLFRTLVDRGILYPVQWALGQSDIKVLNTAAEILAMVLDYDAGGVRGYILRQVEEDARREGASAAAAVAAAAAATASSAGGGPLSAGGAGGATSAAAAATSASASASSHTPTLLAMMTSMLTSPKHELSLKSQLAESFRTLMDVPGLDSTLQGLKILQPQQPVRKEDQQSDRFLDYFYHRCAGDLYKPMLDHVPEHSNVKSYPLELTRAQSDLYLYLCDLLSGFLLQHSYQSHFFVTTNSLAPRIAALLYAREKHLRLAALRFFRTCLRLNNNNVLNHLIKHNIFSPILELTKRESSRDNLLSSCCQEFFEHLRRENYKDVISHIMKGHDALVRQLATSLIVGQRFQGLIQRWDMNNEPPPRQEPKPVQLPMKRWAPTRAIDAEDDYFNAEEETPAAGRQTRGQGRKRGMPNAAGGVTPGNRRPQRPVNVALPRAYPIGTALVDYQEEDETPNGAALTEMPPKTAKSGRLLHQQQPQSQEGPPLRGRNRRADLARTASLIQMDPTSTAGTASTSASTSSASHAPAAGSPSATTTAAAGGSDQPVTIAASRRGSMSASAASEIGPVAMEEDDDLIGPPVSLSLSHKRRRGLDEEDETMERLAKRPALGTSSSPERSPTRSGPGSSGGASAGGGANGPSTTTTTGSPSGSQEASSTESTSHEPTPTTTSRSSKRQLRVKLGNAAMLSSQPPDVKVGDKG